jgi:hypothetical protein
MDVVRRTVSRVGSGHTIWNGKGEKQMANLKRKLVALFFAVVVLAASVAVTGCKKEEPVKPKKPAPSKIPADLQ